jgi:GntR family transcriptional regulator
VPPDGLDAHALTALLRLSGDGPLHTQLEAGLRRLIASGDVPVDALLPAEVELAAELGLSRHTVRHALSALVADGLLQRERRRGTRVLGPAAQAITERSLTSFYAFAWEVSARGVEQRSYVLEREVVDPSPHIRRQLALGAGAKAERIVRLRTAGGEPLVIETAFIPTALMAGLDADVLERGSVYDALERLHGLRVVRAHEVIRPTIVSAALARLLHVRRGAAAFLVERTTWSDRGPIEWQESLVRGDRYLYSVDLRRAD